MFASPIVKFWLLKTVVIEELYAINETDHKTYSCSVHVFLNISRPLRETSQIWNVSGIGVISSSQVCPVMSVLVRNRHVVHRVIVTVKNKWKNYLPKAATQLVVIDVIKSQWRI